MITTDDTRWQSELAGAYTDPASLLERLGIPPRSLRLARGTAGFPLRVPEGFVRRMRAGDPRDPLLLQVLPLAAEDEPSPGFGTDPVGDLAARATDNLLHKYRNRALVITTGACGIHCRYCFRRHFPYGDFRLSPQALEDSLRFLAAHPEIDELILSGGDPLTLGDARLESLLETLAGLTQVRRLRLHTRLPVVVASRVTPRLLALVGGLRVPVVVVVHANHANEIDATTRDQLQRLAGAAALLLNQSVLLRGVNDDCGALEDLSHRLFDAGVLPYYLHQLDPVAGAGHFRVEDAAARRLMDCLRTRLPGYLVPRLVREEAGAPFKIPLEGSLMDSGT